MNMLNEIAYNMVSKGILAADESAGTMGKRLESINLPNTPENRRAWRNLLVSTKGLEDYVSGIILNEETVDQIDIDELTERGIIPGVKVDKGAKPLAGCAGELITEGLDGLRERLQAFSKKGIKFVKWRAVIQLPPNAQMPSVFSMYANAHALTRYAALAQEEGLVPIVEPEVIMDNDCTIEDNQLFTEDAIYTTFNEMQKNSVSLQGVVLKPNMILSGYKCKDQASIEKTVEINMMSLPTVVPNTVAGIAFLSGGQPDNLATERLNALNIESQKNEASVRLTFSFGRGLQATPLKIWGGKNIDEAQVALLELARRNHAASHGKLENGN